jgi:hypothetical protein
MDINDKLKHDQKMAELKQRNQEEYRRVRAALQILCADTNAQIVLRHIAKLAGWFKSSVVLSPTTNDVAVNSTIYNEGRRSLYLDLRRMLTDDARRLIESKGEESHDS